MVEWTTGDPSARGPYECAGHSFLREIHMVKATLTNWRTTVVGVCTALSAWLQCAVAALDSDPLTEPEYGLAVTLTIAAIGLLAARDGNK